jgi:hypothetical protein
MQRQFITNRILAAMLTAIVCTVGCHVEKMPSREEAKDQAEAKKNAKWNAGTVAVTIPSPSTDNAAEVIAACGPAASDQIVTLDDKTESGPVRRMVYNNGRHATTLDFLPLQTGTSSSGNGQATASSNNAWRFNQALVDDQKLLTAANIRVYLPCAANALAKEF